MFERRPQLLRDLALYVLISLAVVAVVIVCAENRWGAGWGRWLLLILTTVLIFYHWIRSGRRLWRQRSFWYVSSALFIGHMLLWLAAMRHFANFQPNLLLTLLEFVAIWFVADWLHPRFARYKMKGVPRL